MRRILERLRAFLGNDDGIDEEIRDHFERDVERRIVAGLTPGAARAATKRAFGSTVAHQEAARDAWRPALRGALDGFATDLKYALRSFRRAPGFTATAFLTLVLGIAGITSLFSYVNAAYYAELPYPKRTIAIGQTQGLFFPENSPAAVQLVREQSKSFEQYSVFDWDNTILDVDAEPLPLQVLGVDTAFRAVLGLKTQLGRYLTHEEILGVAPVAVISSALWRSQFGADPGVVGRELKLASGTLTVVGVAEEGFRYPHRTDVFTGMRMSTDPLEADNPDYGMVGRLRPGVELASAQSEIAVLGRRLSAPIIRRNGYYLHANDEILNRRSQQFLPFPSLFLGAGLFALLIACGNVANLFLARGAERAREVAVRASLGATRGRLIRQSLTETLVLGIAAAVVGTVLSGVIVRVGLSFMPTQNFPSWFQVSVDYRVLAFAAGVTLLVTIATGLMPARVGTRFDLSHSLKFGGDGGASTSAVARSSKRGLAIQLGLAVALSATSMLFVRTYFNLSKVDVGYPAAEIASAMLFFDQARYPTPVTRLPFAEAVASRLDKRPGISVLSLRGAYGGPRQAPGAKPPSEVQRYDGRIIPDGDNSRAIEYLRNGGRVYAVSDTYFGLLGLKVQAGRGFGEGDRQGTEPVVVVSAAAANTFWPLTSALGHTIQMGAKGARARVVGVVDDTHELMGGRQGRNTQARPNIYFPVPQSTAYQVEILARGRGTDPKPARSAIAAAVRDVDPLLAISSRETTLASGQESAQFETKFFGGLVGAFAVVALVLSIIGIYGVVAFGVTTRTREIGVRVALGGTKRDVLGLIVGDAFKFVGIGLVLGLVLAIGLGKVISVVLYGVSPADPWAFAAVCVLFAIVAIVGCYMPARRALAVDPLAALRSE